MHNQDSFFWSDAQPTAFFCEDNNSKMITIARDQVREPLYAIVPVFNPWRWKSRWKHTERALKHFHDSGATIVLVEVAFNRRDFVFADYGLDGTPTNCGLLGSDPKFRHRYIQLRSAEELWLKENSCNVAVSRIPYDWQQLCVLDSDVTFMRPNWVGECIHKLQHYDVIQMFSHARDLGPNYELLPESYPHANGLGFVQAWQEGKLQTSPGSRKAIDPTIRHDLDVLRQDLTNIGQDLAQLTADLGGYYAGPGPTRVFPGLAWAFTRRAFDSLGGLLDFAIWGGGDYHMAWALVEHVETMMHPQLHRNYKKMCMQWYYRCHTHIRRNVGCMSGTITHAWHGRKTGRGYGSKHSLLAKVGFDPLRHLKRDYQGLYQLHDDRSTAFVQIRDLMRKIARERNEDSIDTGLEHFDQGH